MEYSVNMKNGTVNALERIATSLENIEKMLYGEKKDEIEKIEENIAILKAREKNMQCLMRGDQNAK